MGRKIHSEKTDVMIVGAGGAGMATALMLAENGIRVEVFEKMAKAGGTTDFVEGIYAVESLMQRKRNIKITRDEGFHQMMEYSHWRANARLVRAVVNKTGDTIEWLEKHGVEFLEPTADWLGGPMVWHIFKGFGKEMRKKLVSAAESRGVRIHYKTRVKQVLREADNGAVTGGVVEGKDGAEIRMVADAVVIATGGYSSNKEMLKKYAGFDLGTDLFEVVPYEKMGEGIEMAWAAGAAEEGADVILFNNGLPPRTIKPDMHMLGALGQPTLFVNREGVRFCNEEIIQDMIYISNTMSRQPGRYIFRIFDEETKRYLEINGGLGVGYYYSPPRNPLSKLEEEINAAVEKGSPFVFVADTLEDLAQKMGVDTEALRKTVEIYNGFCEKRRDDEFAKDPAYLRPVKVPKFYAFKCHMDILCTMGGIKINEKTEVIDKSEKVIRGLYAAGSDAGGMFGDSYNLTASGIACSFALNSGRIAGENAAQYVKAMRG